MTGPLERGPLSWQSALPTMTLSIVQISRNSIAGRVFHRGVWPTARARSSWKDFLLGLRRRGLNGVEFVVADDRADLRMAIREVLPEAPFQRCYAHFLRNPLDHPAAPQRQPFSLSSLRSCLSTKERP